MADIQSKPLAPLSEKDRAKFPSKVDRRSDSECWLWKGRVSVNGYGMFPCFGKRAIKAHRIAYFLEYGIDPGSLCVCHKCDQRLCVNPNHLFLCTKHENALDASAKGRLKWKDDHLWRKHPEEVLHGERQGMAKLKETEVVEIRKMYASGLWLQREIAAKFGVAMSRISAIVTRKHWKHIP